MEVLANVLGTIINLIFKLTNNYGLTIILFTLFIKVVLFSLNILLQKNSIKMVKMKPELEELKLKYQEDNDSFMEAKIELFKREKYRPILGLIPMLIQIAILIGLTRVLSNPNFYIADLNDVGFLGLDLSAIPNLTVCNINSIMLLIVAITTYLLCYFENRVNVLQVEENKKSQIFSTILTLVITIYFAIYVPVGVSFYWSLGNIFAIFQLYLLNYMYNPKKYIDYERLERIKNVLSEKKKIDLENKQREKDDYKRFLKNGSKQLVFYSEGNGYYKYFEPMIKYILENSDIVIHYITNDANDSIFKTANEKFITYYIGINKCIPLFMKMDADIVIMTTPDLQKYHLKRSMVRKNIEYIFTEHGIVGSLYLVYRDGALDYYDTVFSVNKQESDEIREIEELRNTKRKNIVETGYCLLDEMIKDYSKIKDDVNEKKTILIAPSHQEDNIMDSCLDEILENCLNKGYKIIVRPHPQYIRRNPIKIKELLEKYNDMLNDDFEIQTDFSSADTVYKSDLVITDWSNIGYEFVFTTCKPCLFINTKIKIINSSYNQIDFEPAEIKLRNVVGKSIEKSDINNIMDVITELINNQDVYKENNSKLREEYLFNVGKVARNSRKIHYR